MMTSTPTLVVGSIDTSYGPLQVAAVTGDHSTLTWLSHAATARNRATSADPVVVASGWIDIEVLLAEVGDGVAALPRSTAALPTSVVAAVQAWDAGASDALDTVAVAQPGGDFRQAAWRALREVPGGRVVTYTELAELAGNAKASRAAGSACATNKVAPFVPCHRVVQAGGRVGNYAYGPQLKSDMLAREGAILTL